MALEGSLKEFNLADILQLLFFQKKTGALVLQGRTDRVRLMFRDGNIVGADSRKRDPETRLGRVLEKRGLVSAEDMKAAMDKQKSEGGKLGFILLKDGFVTREQIVEVLTFQIKEAMVQLFTWQEGKYEFVAQSVPVDKELGVELNTEHFLMEGVRLVDEWSMIKDKITFDTIFFKVEGSTSELTEEEARALECVDGKSDVAQIADVMGIDSFQVSTLLLQLLEKGAIAKLQSKESAAELEAQRVVVTPIPGLGAMLYLLVILALGASIGAFYMFRGSLHEFKAWQQLDTLHGQIMHTYYETGSFPPVIEQQDPWGNPLFYSHDNKGYTIKSPGPDGQPDTPDDIY